MTGGDIAWRRMRPQATPNAVGSVLSGALPLPDRPCIAPLPFADPSGDPEQEYFSDGVADDIITELSRNRALFVIARNSSLTYRGRSIDRSTSSKSGGSSACAMWWTDSCVRVTAQLIDATTDSYVWAERCDRSIEHV